MNTKKQSTIVQCTYCYIKLRYGSFYLI